MMRSGMLACFRMRRVAVAVGHGGLTIGFNLSGLVVGVEGRNITLKEILLVVLACAVWGPRWRGRKVVAHVDNEGAVAVLKDSGYAMPRICG